MLNDNILIIIIIIIITIIINNDEVLIKREPLVLPEHGALYREREKKKRRFSVVSNKQVVNWMVAYVTFQCWTL